MKLGLFTLLSALPFMAMAQTGEKEYPNTFSSGSSRISPFDNNSRMFKDWSVSLGLGSPIMHSSDFTSLNADNRWWGQSMYVSLDKQVTHFIGLGLHYQLGHTRQSGRLPLSNPDAQKRGLVAASTHFHAISAMMDLNLSNLFRRVDNRSPYRWALHGYIGAGFMGFTNYRHDQLNDPTTPDTNLRNKSEYYFKQPLGLSSFFAQAGAGVRYKINQHFDAEARAMYLNSGDDEFDGSGDTQWEYPGYSRINYRVSDDLLTLSLGVTYKIGRQDSHLTWHDPLQNIYYQLDLLDGQSSDIQVCKKGDFDDDGVCDDWDRQQGTPRGARVDGAGRALDIDKDGTIDLYDKCVTVHGPKDNSGCPKGTKQDERLYSDALIEINRNLTGIQFELNKAIIRRTSYAKLDAAAEVIKMLEKTRQFKVVGATDTRGTKEENQDLSMRRATAVREYLISKGVESHMLTAEGRGMDDLKYPECNPASKCPEWKNEANRRVFFVESIQPQSF